MSFLFELNSCDMIDDSKNTFKYSVLEYIYVFVSCWVLV